MAYNDPVIEELVRDPRIKVCSDGSIWSLITETGKTSVSGRWRKLGRQNNGGYYTFKYKRYNVQFHRVVFRALVGPLEPDLVVDHKDADPSNNHPDNLQLISQNENNARRASRAKGK